MIRRIAMLSVHTSPLAVLGGKKTGGMNVYVRELSRELGRRGICVDVFTRSQDPNTPRISTALGSNVRVIQIPTGPEMALDPDQVYPYLPEFTGNVLAFAAREARGYDLIYSHYWLSGWAGHELRQTWDVPLAQMFHTLGLMKDRIAYHLADHPADLRSSSEAEIMSWADRLIAATPAERAQLLWLYRAPRRKIEIVPPGVDLTRFHPIDRVAAKHSLGIPTDRRVLLFVGRIEPLKGIDTILEALAVIKRETPNLVQNLYLSIIGGSPDDPLNEDAEMTRLKDLRISLDLAELVTFLGAKDQETLNQHYAAAEALIMPSDYESFGMVALEAMASGTPVIASEVGGLAFLVHDGYNGYLVPVREPSALAERIRAILENPDQRERLAQNATLTAQDYAWPLIADRLLEIFESMLVKQAAL